jgi:hypothetical protein
MREEGFEPSQALSYCGLNAARLTTPALPHNKMIKSGYLKFSKNIKEKEYEEDNISVSPFARLI